MVAGAHRTDTQAHQHAIARQKDALVEVLRRVERHAWFCEFGSRESLQDDHRRATAWAMPKRILGDRGRQFAGSTRKRSQQFTAKRYPGSAEAIGEKSEVTNAHECFGQNMQEEAAQEFACSELHLTVLATVGV